MLLTRTVGILAISIFLSGSHARTVPRAATTEISTVSPAIVVGFVGGFVRHDDAVHAEVQLAARLRKEYPGSVAVETFENRSGEKAYRKILSLLDTNHDTTLSNEEKRNARIVLYGHSWGASEIVALARRLEKDSVPILLTIQVDSVSKMGAIDEVIPGNVAQAINFYQVDGLLHGATEIRAADANRTKILGNFRFSYEASSYNCTDYPWYNRVFMRAHTQIECDSIVWDQVETLIRSHLPGGPENGPAQ